MKGKFTDYVRPIVIIMLTIGLLYGFYKQYVKGDQYSLIYASVISFLFGETYGRKGKENEK